MRLEAREAGREQAERAERNSAWQREQEAHRQQGEEQRQASADTRKREDERRQRTAQIKQQEADRKQGGRWKEQAAERAKASSEASFYQQKSDAFWEAHEREGKAEVERRMCAPSPAGTDGARFRIPLASFSPRRITVPMPALLRRRDEGFSADRLHQERQQRVQSEKKKADVFYQLMRGAAYRRS